MDPYISLWLVSGTWCLIGYKDERQTPRLDHGCDLPTIQSGVGYPYQLSQPLIAMQPTWY